MDPAAKQAMTRSPEKPMSEVPQLLDELMAVVSSLEDNYAGLSNRLAPVKRSEPSQSATGEDRGSSTQVGESLQVAIRRIRGVSAVISEDQDLLEL